MHSYPEQRPKLRSKLFRRKRLSNFELRISLTSYSMSPSISTGGGGGWAHCGNGSGSAGSNWDMWKTGWTERKCWGRQRVNECEPGMAITSYRSEEHTSDLKSHLNLVSRL